MKAPRFWNTQNSLIAKLLQPVSRVYGAIVQKRLQRMPLYISKLPVICVGNVTMGGSGKTPVVQAIAHLLKEAGKNPAVLLRGYGGSNTSTLAVDSDAHSAALVGDEALLHAQNFPTVVSRDRVKGAQAIEKDTWHTHIVMDDGLQNPSLKKTLSLLVVDGADPFGNGEIFPAGPLRETIDTAIRRVDALIVMGQKNKNLVTRFGFLLPIFHAALVPVNISALAGKKIVAFAGIGNPRKFFGMLRAGGADVVAEREFADHHLFAPREIEGLLKEAAAQDSLLVTTRKDWVRLAPSHRERVHVLDVALQWEDRAAMTDFLRQKDIL